MSSTRARRPRIGLHAILARLLLGGLVLGFALVPATVQAVAAPGAAPRLTLSARPLLTGRPAVELLARLAPSGAPAGGQHRGLGGVMVTFAVHLDEFAGAPLLTLGSATTDRAGDAHITYTPTFTGRQALTATATDASGNTIATAAASYLVTAAVNPLAGTAQAVRPDGGIGKVVVGVLLGLVVLLWIVLVAIVVRVTQRSPRASLP